MYNSVCYIFIKSYYTLYSTGLSGGKNMNIQFKKGALEFIVLLIIKGEDQYGYSLIQKSHLESRFLKVRFILC